MSYKHTWVVLTLSLGKEKDVIIYLKRGEGGKKKKKTAQHSIAAEQNCINNDHHNKKLDQ